MDDQVGFIPVMQVPFNIWKSIRLFFILIGTHTKTTQSS